MADFGIAVEILLKHEGGYVWDPDDPGGETRFGISKRWNPGVDIKRLSRTHAIVIYRRRWWNRYRYGEIEDQDIANKLLSISVNAGPRNTHRMLQRTLNEENVYTGTLKVDGILGPKTLATIGLFSDRGEESFRLLMAFKLQAIRFYLARKPRARRNKYIVGWIQRAIS